MGLRWALAAAALVLLPGCGSSTPAELAFTSTRDGNAEVYVVRADGSGLRNLTANLANDGQPTWSPDGTKLAFTSLRDGNAELYAMNADGSGQKRLTRTPLVNETAPAWSPDGTTIAAQCTHARPTPVTQICVVDAEGGGARTLTGPGGGDNLYPVWSPDSSEVLYSSARASTGGRYAIYASSLVGRGERLVTKGPGAAGEPAFAPDGASFAYIGRGTRWRLYVAAHGESSEVPAPPGRIDAPAWSPDGDRIAFMRLPPGKSPRSDLYVASPDGTDLVRLTDGPGNSLSPSWSPDGEQLAFVRLSGRRADVYVVHGDGTGEQRLTTGAGQNGTPLWRPTG